MASLSAPEIGPSLAPAPKGPSASKVDQFRLPFCNLNGTPGEGENGIFKDVRLRVMKYVDSIQRNHYRKADEILQDVKEIYQILSGKRTDYSDGRFLSSNHRSYWDHTSVPVSGISQIRIIKRNPNVSNIAFHTDVEFEMSLFDIICRLCSVSSACVSISDKRTWSLGGLPWDCAIAAAIACISLSLLYNLPDWSTLQQYNTTKAKVEAFLLNLQSLERDSILTGTTLASLSYIDGSFIRKRVGAKCLCDNEIDISITHRKISKRNVVGGTAAALKEADLLNPKKTAYATAAPTRSPSSGTASSVSASGRAQPAPSALKAFVSISTNSTTPSTLDATNTYSASTSTSAITNTSDTTSITSSLKTALEDTPSASNSSILPSISSATPDSTGTLATLISKEESLDYILKNRIVNWIQEGMEKKEEVFTFDLDGGKKKIIEDFLRIKNVTNVAFWDEQVIQGTGEMDHFLRSSGLEDDDIELKRLTECWRTEQDGDNPEGGSLYGILELLFKYCDRIFINIYILTPFFMKWISSSAVVKNFFSKGGIIYLSAPRIHARTTRILIDQAEEDIRDRLKALKLHHLNQSALILFDIISMAYPAAYHSKTILASNRKRQIIHFVDGSGNLSIYGTGGKAHIKLHNIDPNSPIPPTSQVSSETIISLAIPWRSYLCRHFLSQFDIRSTCVVAAGRSFDIKNEKTYKDPHQLTPERAAEYKVAWKQSFQLDIPQETEEELQSLAIGTAAAQLAVLNYVYPNRIRPETPSKFILSEEHRDLEDRISLLRDFRVGEKVEWLCMTCLNVYPIADASGSSVIADSSSSTRLLVYHPTMNGSQPRQCVQQPAIGLSAIAVGRAKSDRKSNLVALQEMRGIFLKHTLNKDFETVGAVSLIYPFYQSLTANIQSTSAVISKFLEWIQLHRDTYEAHPELDILEFTFRAALASPSYLSSVTKSLSVYFGPEVFCKGSTVFDLSYTLYYNKLKEVLGHVKLVFNWGRVLASKKLGKQNETDGASTYDEPEDESDDESSSLVEEEDEDCMMEAMEEARLAEEEG